ncbi:condensation domain-containing protein [Dyella tabacisoli]|nr:condensation domain-containing protein [Dyella tabacisoli]
MLPTQRALWRLDRTLSDPSVLNLAFGLLLDGPFNVQAMEWTLQELVRRHEPLRTNYSGPAGFPVAEVVSDVRLELEYADLSHLAQETRTAELARSFREAATRRIDTPPLLRAGCVLLEPDLHLLLLTFNHLGVDGWALELLGHEAEQLYSARLARADSPLAPLPPDPLETIERDWLVWRQGPRAQTELAQKRRELGRLDTRAVHPFGVPAENTQSMRRRVLGIPPQALANWRTAGARIGSTLFPGIIAAVAFAICRQLQIPEVVIGILIANRHSSAAQRVLGAHYGATFLRLAAAAGTSLTDVMSQATEGILEATSHRLDIDTLAELVGECAGASKPLVPSCMVVMDRYPMHRFAVEDVQVSPISTLATYADQLHADMDMPTSPAGDFIVFLRQFADTAGVTVFWKPERIVDIEPLIADIAGVIEDLGGALEPASCSPMIAGSNASTYALAHDGWKATVPAVDALSPLPLLGSTYR